jgi:hypothetical protein
LFRRVAAKGGADLTEVELLSRASIGSA